MQFLCSMIRHKQAVPPFLPPSGSVRLLLPGVHLLRSGIHSLTLLHRHKWNTCLKKSASQKYHFPLCNNFLPPSHLICHLAYLKNIPFSHPRESSAGLYGCVFLLSPLIYLYLQAAFSISSRLFLATCVTTRNMRKKECALAHSRACGGRLRHLSYTPQCASSRSIFYFTGKQFPVK